MLVFSEYQTGYHRPSPDFYGYEDCPGTRTWPCYPGQFCSGHFGYQGKGSLPLHKKRNPPVAGISFFSPKNKVTYYKADREELGPTTDWHQWYQGE